MTYQATERVDAFFAHHGIKGQKWGMRRFQNADGSLTEDGKKRYLKGDGRQVSEKKELTGYQRSLSAKFQKRGLTKEQADEAAIRRAKVLKRVGIIAGTVTAAAVAGYVAHNVSRDFFDKTIKAGTTIQTLSNQKDRMDTGDSFYTAYKKKDKTTYEALFGRDMFSTDNKYAIQRSAKENVKIASRRNSKKMFDTLMKTDEEFASDFKKYKSKAPEVFGKKSEDSYDFFNRIGLLDDRTPEASRMRAKFYSEAKKRGYGGVLDINDAKYSGYDTTPAIVFAREKFGNEKISTLADSKIDSSMKKWRAKQIIKGFIHPVQVAEFGVAGAAIALSKDDKKVKKQIAENKKKEKEGDVKNAKSSR